MNEISKRNMAESAVGWLPGWAPAGRGGSCGLRFDTAFLDLSNNAQHVASRTKGIICQFFGIIANVICALEVDGREDCGFGAGHWFLLVA